MRQVYFKVYYALVQLDVGVQRNVCCVAAPLLDPRDAGGGGCDTLHSQTSRGTHSDASSCIMEVPEEGKEDCE